ncbi:MAG: hypothetical protein HPY69_15090 [Armatimonadetes bacterium]|nr:hypothetical protein [Armatimonadota bacterium]
MTEPLVVRPYRLLCLFCSLGGELPEPLREPVAALRQAIQDCPDRPLALRCQAEDVYAYQHPGRDEDTPEGAEYNRKRDLDVLYCLDLPPGAILPARTLLYRVLAAVPTVKGICGYDAATAAWPGCERAASGCYEKGIQRGIEGLIPPRDAAECAREKQASVAEMEREKELRIRPHVIMCAVCNYGAADGAPEPLAADNIVEFIRIVRRNPRVPVKLVPGADWMICAPCPQRVPGLNACVNVAGSGGLSNEKRDLDLLQLLDLTYGATLPGRELLLRIFDRVPSTQPICRRDSPRLSVWWDGCGESNRGQGNPGYARGRALLLAELRPDQAAGLMRAPGNCHSSVPTDWRLQP